MLQTNLLKFRLDEDRNKIVDPYITILSNQRILRSSIWYLKEGAIAHEKATSDIMARGRIAIRGFLR